MTRGPGQESPYTARKEGHPPFGYGVSANPLDDLRYDVPPAHPPVHQTFWYGCEHPERPFEVWRTAFRADCRPCVLAARAAERNGFGRYERWLEDDGEFVSLADWTTSAETQMLWLEVNA